MSDALPVVWDDWGGAAAVGVQRLGDSQVLSIDWYILFVDACAL